MMQHIWLICGIPGCGKTHCCRSVQDRFTYVPHDQYINPCAETPIAAHQAALLRAAKGGKPVIGECPFMMSVMIGELRKAGAVVHPIFVLESAEVIRERYEQRERRPIPPQHLTRVKSIPETAKQFAEFSGTSQQVMDYMNRVIPTNAPIQQGVFKFPAVRMIK